MMRHSGIFAATLALSGCVIVDEGGGDPAASWTVSGERTSEDDVVRYRGADWDDSVRPPYSAMVAHGGVLHLAGTLGFTPGTRDLPDGITAQTGNALSAIEANLAQAGAGLDDVLSCTCYLADMADFAAFNAAYSAVFTKDPPARTTIGVARLPLDARVEITCIAAQPESL